MSEETGAHDHVVVNVSAGGVALSHGPLLVPGGEVRVLLRIPDEPLMSVDGRVLRSWAADGRTGAAVEFTDLAADVEDRIQGAVSRLLAAQADASRLGVLVVDSEALVRRELARDIVSLGHEVATAARPCEAIARLDEGDARLRVAVVGPCLGAAIDAFEVLDQLATEHPEVRRVLLTASACQLKPALAKLSGRADAVLARPWRAERIASVI